MVYSILHNPIVGISFLPKTQVFGSQRLRVSELKTNRGYTGGVVHKVVKRTSFETAKKASGLDNRGIYDETTIGADMCSEGWTSWAEIHKRAIASRSKYRPKIVDAGLYDNEQSEAKLWRIILESASYRLTDNINKAGFAMSAYGADSQRTTKDADRIGGLGVFRTTNQLSTASFGYGIKKNNETILIFDLGDTTFIVSVLKLVNGVFEVLSTSGEIKLGGNDFDKRIIDWLAADFKRRESINLMEDKHALQRLTEIAEKAKMKLSSLTQTTICLLSITAARDVPKHIETILTRAKFEDLCSDLLHRLKTPVENALKDAKLSFKDFDVAFLVGGSTRIPAVQELVKNMTGKEPKVAALSDPTRRTVKVLKICGDFFMAYGRRMDAVERGRFACVQDRKAAKGAGRPSSSSCQKESKL